MNTNYRSLWISDLHLGNPAARAADLLKFLSAVQCERLYLVGDIIDLKRMKSRPLFPETHLDVLRKLLSLALKGVEVTYIPGNHDYEFRDLVGRDLCGVHVALEVEHVTAVGERLLVTHGDILDRAVRRGTSLEQFGAAAYNVILQLDAKVNELRDRMGREHISISRRIKERLASANEYISRFEQAAARYARDREYHGIVCGHIHRPSMLMIDGIRYTNDGDWVEHRTALAETGDGQLQLLRWAHNQVHVIPTPENRSLAA